MSRYIEGKTILVQKRTSAAQLCLQTSTIPPFVLDQHSLISTTLPHTSPLFKSLHSPILKHSFHLTQSYLFRFFHPLFPVNSHSKPHFLTSIIFPFHPLAFPPISIHQNYTLSNSTRSTRNRIKVPRVREIIANLRLRPPIAWIAITMRSPFPIFNIRLFDSRQGKIESLCCLGVEKGDRICCYSCRDSKDEEEWLELHCGKRGEES